MLIILCSKWEPGKPCSVRFVCCALPPLRSVLLSTSSYSPPSLEPPALAHPQVSCWLIGKTLKCSLGRESKNKKPTSGENVIWIYNHFFVQLIPPVMRERPQWMKLLLRRGLSTRTVITKEWSTDSFMLIFMRRSCVCVAPSVPSKAGLQEQPCVALSTYTYANAGSKTASCVECPFPFWRLPCPLALGAVLRAWNWQHVLLIIQAQ